MSRAAAAQTPPKRTRIRSGMLGVTKEISRNYLVIGGFFFLSLSILISDRCGATADAGMRAVRPIDAVDAVVASGWESVVIVATHPAASVHTRFK